MDFKMKRTNQIIPLTSSQSNALTLLRCAAVLLIISTHIVQELHSQWCTVLNIGVQIFFILSGYIYGKRTISDIKSWFIKRTLRILVPFYVYLIVALPIVLYVNQIPLDFSIFVTYLFSLQGFYDGLPGLGHLWFISWILICYALTPILQYLHHSKRLFYLFSLMIVITVLGYFNTHFFWILLYMMTYFISRLNLGTNRILLLLYTFSSFFLLALFAWNRGRYYYIAFHLCIPLFMVFSTISLFTSKVRCFRIGKLLGWINNYSYEIYLSHHAIILGACSLLYFTNNITLNIVIILAMSIMQAYILKIVSMKIIDFIKISMCPK